MCLTKELLETGIDELELVGGKNASLGEMLRFLTGLGIQIPNGFVVTSVAYDYYINHNNLNNKIEEIINKTNIDDLVDLRRNSLKIRNLIKDGEFPEDLKIEVLDKYKKLSKQFKDCDNNPQDYTDVAVRSSGTSEDLPDASFAGQQDTFLNVRGNNQLIEKIVACFASLYNDRAICYRKTMGYSNSIVKIAVCVQKMVRSDLGSSGVAFSLDPDSGYKNVVVINSSWGLGEIIVSGQVKPDEFIVFKPTLLQNYNSIIDKKIGDKIHKMVYSDELNKRTKIVHVEPFKQNIFSLEDTQILQLSKWIILIEQYYSKKYERWCPVDIEWALDGLTNNLYIVQARPETIHSRKVNKKEYVEYKLDLIPHKDSILLTGIAVGSNIGSGKVKIVFSLDTREGEEPFQEGDILVAEYTDPTYEPLMKIASAIITDKGGRTSHAAIVSRELGKPAIVGCENATDILKNNKLVTVDCSQGETGFVYSDILDFSVKKTDLSTLPNLKNINTGLMLNIGNPEAVFHHTELPVVGVGLAREEFIIGASIGIHPNAILNFEKNNDKLKKDILHKIKGFTNPVEYYVKKLSFGIGKIGAAFFPRPVIVRFSDFKSNEYKDLLGGNIYEPNEENPMLGFRGCSRYYSDTFKEAFGLECKAIKIVREQMGLDNIIVMLPFCRTVEECIKTLDTMKEYGLERGQNGLQIYLMCEIPSNVILADDFCKYVDGFSIGSNDLTQLTLGLDRDAGNLSFIGNETNEAVKKMISKAIKKCKKNGVKIGICGQGPSDIPEFAKFLIDEGIDTISLVPDSIFKTIFDLSKI